MLACVRTAAVYGIEAWYRQRGSEHAPWACPVSRWSGCPMPPVRESRDRVRSAIRNSGYEFPEHRVTVNLAPADIREAVLTRSAHCVGRPCGRSGAVTRRNVDDVLLLGELSLDGGIHSARGVLPIAAAARRERFSAGCYFPTPTAPKRRLSRGFSCMRSDLLTEAVTALSTIRLPFCAAPDAGGGGPCSGAAGPPGGGGPRRCPRSGAGPTGAGDRGCRRPQHADDWTARIG